MGVFVSTGWSTDPCGAALHVMSWDLVGLQNFRNVNWPGANQLIQAAPLNTHEPQQLHNLLYVSNHMRLEILLIHMNYLIPCIFVCVFMIGGGGDYHQCAGRLKLVRNYHLVESMRTSGATFKLIQIINVLVLLRAAWKLCNPLQL